MRQTLEAKKRVCFQTKEQIFGKFCDLAGAVGFEPTIHDTKNRCLTTWLRPTMKLWPRPD